MRQLALATQQTDYCTLLFQPLLTKTAPYQRTKRESAWITVQVFQSFTHVNATMRYPDLTNQPRVTTVLLTVCANSVTVHITAYQTVVTQDG